MKWTQEELEQLYQQVNAKAAQDEAFRKEVLTNPKAALEKMAGRKLPDEFNLKIIENDSGFASTYIVPDFVQGELDVQELGSEALGQVSGGVSFFLIVTVCAAAVAVGPCPGDACGAAACGGNVCGGAACGADACGGNACGGAASGVSAGCGGAACGGDACAANIGCAGYSAGADVCGANVGCAAYASSASACGANKGCAANASGASACGSNRGCQKAAGGASTCGNYH